MKKDIKVLEYLCLQICENDIIFFFFFFNFFVEDCKKKPLLWVSLVAVPVECICGTRSTHPVCIVKKN